MLREGSHLYRAQSFHDRIFREPLEVNKLQACRHFSVACGIPKQTEVVYAALGPEKQYFLRFRDGDTCWSLWSAAKLKPTKKNAIVIDHFCCEEVIL